MGASSSSIPKAAAVSDADDWEEPQMSTLQTDDASTDVVMTAILQCATAWDGRARIIGNIRAADIAIAVTDHFALCDAFDDLIDALESGEVVAGHEAMGKAKAALAHVRRETKTEPTA